MSPIRPQSWGLASRLLAATTAVILVAAATAWVVTAAIGPGIFHDHLLRFGTTDPEALLHAKEAFRYASAISLAVALVAAVATSAVVSGYLTRRVGRSLAAATQAARRVAVGDHTARVPAVGMGCDFEELAEAFNAMAADLGAIEASRTRMLGDLAHEMRTPVATLDAHLEAIQDGVRHPDPDTLTLLRTQVGRLARLAEDIALVTTTEEGRLTMRRVPVRVARIVADARNPATARYATAGVHLNLHVTGEAADAVVIADGDRIGQVLTNLLDNALRHTPRGGTVTLTTTVRGADVVFDIADTGTGIDPEHLPHLFERFYRVDAARDRAHGGSGVGLAIVRAIVTAHQGTVTATSPGVGRGARFTVTLPLSPGTAT
ncbi:MAG: HAMP domain-containing sensor histidine kinase [Actinomycetota bacterium]